MKTIFKLFFFVFCCITTSQFVRAQEIDFGSFSSVYAAANTGSIDFGEVAPGFGVVSVTIDNAEVVEITAVEYMDISVSLTATDLTLGGGICNDASCLLEFTMQAAYVNKGELVGSNPAAAVLMTNTAPNVYEARFAVKQRSSGPPGPPPTPVYDGYDPNIEQYQETAYLLIYGSLNLQSLGVLTAGAYSGNITITINYE